MRQRRRQSEGGFALLMVFVMAAGIALMLYNQLPRTAFESMRGKEELLVDRASQFQRAIQLYVAKYQKYPANLDDLEKTNNIRFLRKRYKNPFTGKDDWRLIHVDNMGKLTDSLVQQKEEKKPNQNTFITEMAGIGQTSTTGDEGGVNVALRRRPSEGGDGSTNGPAPLPLPPTGFQQSPFQQPQQGQQPQVPNPIVDPNNPTAAAQAQPGQQQQPGQQPQPGFPGQPGQQPGQQPLLPGQQQPGQPPNLQAIYPNGVPQYPGQPNPGINPQTGQRYLPGQQPQYPNPGVPPQGQQQQQQNYGMMGPPQPGIGASPQTYPTQAATGQPNFGQGTPQSALDAINKALTSPSPNMPMNLAPGLQIMGGLAGVAPKNEGPSIRIVNEQTNYKKWEFVYDMKKDNRMRQALGQQQNMMNQGNNPMGNNPGGIGGNRGGFGNNQPGGFGNNQPGGFGNNQPGGFGNNPQPVGYGPGSPTSGQQPVQQPPNPFGRR